jgi:hypothetical protein
MQTVVIDDDILFFTQYLRGSGVTIKQIEESQAIIRKIFDSSNICVNDFKSHIRALGIERCVNFDVYDLSLSYESITPKDECHGKLILANIAKEMMGIKPQKWHRLLANASSVYQYLEDVGIRYGIKKVTPRYSLDTTTGRSKSLGFNVQGTSEDFDIRSTHDDFNVLVHFDWIAVDLRMAAFMSNDSKMNAIFTSSDPYTEIATYYKLTRSECKGKLLKAIYSLSIDDSVLDIFPSFQKWANSRIKQMRTDGYLTSIMGRRFDLDGDNDKTVFNAQFQGSVAQAMQAALVKVFPKYKNHLIAEIHDCLVLSCPEEMVGSIIKDVVPIMLDPLYGWVSPSPRMPVRVSVGKKWKSWKEYKVFR